MSNKDKKIRKLAVIRDNDNRICPFGLDITSSCKNVGDSIEKMAPLDVLGDKATDEEKKKLATANKRLFRWYMMNEGVEPKKCIYADQIFEDKDKEKVNCNYGDTGAGISQKSTLLGAPFYSQMFSGTGITGIYTIPVGQVHNTPMVSNLYYGLYSLHGSDKEKLKDLIRLADYILEHKIGKK